jgi:hypothetical protein
VRTPDILRLTALLTVTILLAMGGCSDSPTEAPTTVPPDETPAGPAITVLEDLSLSRQSLLVNQGADMVVRIKTEAPDPYAITSVSLHELDAAGESLAQLAVLLDDGESASADMVASDKIYSGQATGLLYVSPDTLDLAIRVIAEADGEEDLILWTDTSPLPVLRTDLVFLAGPRSFPQGITTAVNTDLRVVAELGLADSLSLRGVDLYRVTAEGDSVLFLGPMADNGNLDNGDEIMSDGNYTGIMNNMFVVAPQTIYIKALATAFSAESGLTHLAWSPTLEVPVEYPPTLGLVETALANQDSVETLWDHYLSIDMEPAAAKDSLLAWLDRRDHILDNYLSPDGATLWTVYFNGFEAGVMLAQAGDPATYGASRPHRDPAETAHLMSVGVPAGRSAATGGALGDRNPEIPDEVDSNLALVYSPFHDWVESLPGQDDPAVAVAAAFEDAHCPSFGVTALHNGTADLQALKELYRYGAISIFTHGVQLAGGQTAMLTGEVVDYPRCVANAWDLFTFNPAACIVRWNGVSHFAVKPEFFGKYTQHYPNSVVQITACYSAVNNMLPLAFTGQGAGFFTGFDGSVSVGFAAESSVAFWSNLLEAGDRSGPAHDNVSPQVDPGHEGAAFTAQGNPDLFFGTDLQNGGFELGSLAAWDKSGDGRVISRLDDQLPVSGNAMGIISTGLGYTDSTGEITQAVCVPAGAAWLRFNYNFFSEEFIEWCGSGYQDYFRVSIIDEGDNETELFYIQIDQMCDDVIPANIQFDQGPLGDDNGVYLTGWRNLDLGINPWAGQTVTLRFAAGDIGDSIFDSAILIDAIRIE